MTRRICVSAILLLIVYLAYDVRGSKQRPEMVGENCKELY